jgi:uncharacterized protein (TIGR02452 family)
MTGMGQWLFTPRDPPSGRRRKEGDPHSDSESHQDTHGHRTQDFRQRHFDGGHADYDPHRQGPIQDTQDVQYRQHEAGDGSGRGRLWRRHSFHENQPFQNSGGSDADRTRHFVHIANQNRVLIRNLMQGQDQLGHRLRYSRTSAALHVRPPPLQTQMYQRRPPTAKVHVVPLDSLDAADILRGKGVPESDIVVLNMANENTPGGWYLTGAGAQEEALCRRSSLYATIGPGHGFHPIRQPGAIFSPDVLVMRKSDEQGCEQLHPYQMWWTSVISVAAVFRPPLSIFGNDFARMEDKEEMRARIKTLFRVIVWSGKKSLVLSALGCGAFRNPPEAVAQLFKEVLQEDEFCGRFQGIWFAILDRRGSRNFQAFGKVFDKLVV